MMKESSGSLVFLLLLAVLYVSAKAFPEYKVYALLLTMIIGAGYFILFISGWLRRYSKVLFSLLLIAAVSSSIFSPGAQRALTSVLAGYVLAGITDFFLAKYREEIKLKNPSLENPSYRAVYITAMFFLGFLLAYFVNLEGL